ncbi:hypothetical protein MOSE0_E05204 [Monosporozyma servazzii]
MTDTNNNQQNIKNNSDNIESFTIPYHQNRLGTNEHSLNRLYTNSSSNLDNRNGSAIRKVQSHTVLPTISSLINPEPESEFNNSDSNGHLANESVKPGLKPQSGDNTKISTNSITKANSFPSINTISQQHHPIQTNNINNNNMPALLYQPQNQMKVQPQQQVSYTQYLSSSNSNPINPPAIPNSRFNSQNVLVPHPQIQQPYIQTLQYAIPVQQQQPQLAMVNSNGVLTEMTPINFISPMGLQQLGLPQVQSFPPQQYMFPHPSTIQYQGQNNAIFNLDQSNSIEYPMAPIMNNNNNNNNNNNGNFNNKTPFGIDSDRSRLSTFKSPSLPNVTTAPTYITNSSRAWSLPMETNTSTPKTKRTNRKSPDTSNASNCNTNVTSKATNKTLSTKVSKRPGEHTFKKLKTQSNIHSASQFIRHGKPTKVDDKNKNYTVDFSSAVKHRKQCGVCGKICSRPSTLKTHYLIHTGDTPFKCTFEGCNKAFNVKSNMLRHMKCHQRDK